MSFIEISNNKKYLVPDLNDQKTMTESIKRVREMLMERLQKSKRGSSSSVRDF